MDRQTQSVRHVRMHTLAHSQGHSREGASHLWHFDIVLSSADVLRYLSSCFGMHAICRLDRPLLDKHAFPDPLHRCSISAHMSRVILACTFCFIPLQNVPRGCHEGCFSFPFSSLCKNMPRKMVKHFVFPVPRLFVPAIFLPQFGPAVAAFFYQEIVF